MGRNSINPSTIDVTNRNARNQEQVTSNRARHRDTSSELVGIEDSRANELVTPVRRNLLALNELLLLHQVLQATNALLSSTKGC